VACPFFLPIERIEGANWLHAGRLPLGRRWAGQCTAPGHEGENPSQEELREFCNLGYAEGCGRLPLERTWDAVRFAARTAQVEARGEGCGRIQVRYVCESGHRPAEHGFLEFDAVERAWPVRHPDARVQRMAECFLESYLEKRKKQDALMRPAS